ncbi:LysM peptidoglycan-binding domain-containing protein [Akkermansiaceae bacterium]|nr:LysM peptidoglycan-binding domain-containing protein [Akkermansiaceae bacterium]
MKLLTLTSSLIATLLLPASFASAESASTFRALITAKETELSRVQNELTSLRKGLASANSTAAPASISTYTVNLGDTMSSIARLHKMTYSELVKLNKITDPSLITVGQEINVSTDTKTSAPEKVAIKAPAPTAKTSKHETHVVKRGETFYRIATTNKISVGKLKELNPGVDTNHITEGQKLKISGKPAAQIASRKRSSTWSAAQVSHRPTPVSAPKKSSTPALTRSAASKKTVASSQPTSSRKIAEPKVATVKKEVASAPAPPKVKEPMPAAPKKVSSVILTNETSFSDFASKHGTSTTSLNALNGWNLPKATVLARGSEIYVPK